MQRRTALLALGGTGVLVTIWTLVVAYAKSHAGAFNALDAGIYTQVAWLTSHGQPFGFTIHPHLYLGDHLEVLFALAALPFRLFPSIFTLIALQCLAVVGAAFALFRFTRRFGNISFACAVGLAFLLNPFTLNALHFEFHAVLFGLPFAFLAATAFVDKSFPAFAVWSALLVLAREDLALLVGGLAIVALLERRPLRWWLWPALFAAGWYVGANVLAGMINGEGYKFLQGLSGSGGLMQSFSASAQLGNILVALALLLPVLGLPLFAWRWLPVLALPFFGLGLAGIRAGDLILQTHYAVFFLPGLACASVVGWHLLWQRPRPWLFGGKSLVTLVFAAVSIYSLLTFGPTISTVRAWAQVQPAEQEKAAIARDIARTTPTEDAVLAGYSTLLPAANRARVYASHYAFLGKRQYSLLPYPVPNDVALVLLDAEDFVTYQLQYSASPSRADDYRTGAERFRALLQDRQLVLTETHDTLLVFRRAGTDLLPTVVTRAPRPIRSDTPFAIAAHAKRAAAGSVALSVEGQVGDLTLANVQVRLSWYTATGALLGERLLPFGYGLFPTTSWALGEVVTTHFTLTPPQGAASITIAAIVPDGFLSVNGWRAVSPHLTAQTKTLAAVERLPIED